MLLSRAGTLVCTPGFLCARRGGCRSVDHRPRLRGNDLEPGARQVTQPAVAGRATRSAVDALRSSVLRALHLLAAHRHAPPGRRRPAPRLRLERGQGDLRAAGIKAEHDEDERLTGRKDRAWKRRWALWLRAGPEPVHASAFKGVLLKGLEVLAIGADLRGQPAPAPLAAAAAGAAVLVVVAVGVAVRRPLARAPETP